MRKLQKLIYALLSVFIVAVISAYFAGQGINFRYHNAASGRFAPPDSVFPVVWSLLYLPMALSFYEILILPRTPKTLDAKLLFLSQLLLNIVWCFAFFHAKQLAVGFCVILMLDYLVYKTISAFHRLRRASAFMLYPYFLWLCYASFFNLIFIINNGLIVDF